MNLLDKIALTIFATLFIGGMGLGTIAAGWEGFTVLVFAGASLFGSLWLAVIYLVWIA